MCVCVYVSVNLYIMYIRILQILSLTAQSSWKLSESDFKELIEIYLE